MRRLALFISFAVAGCSQQPVHSEYRELKEQKTGKESYAVFVYPLEGKKDVNQISFSCEKGEPIFFSMLLSRPIAQQTRATLTYKVDDLRSKAFYATGDESGGIWFEKDREGSTVRDDWLKGSKLTTRVAITGGGSYDATFDIANLAPLLERLDGACSTRKAAR